jgi:hypothetical protein
MTPGPSSRHLRDLADESLDAAFVGSTVAPEVAARENGLQRLAFDDVAATQRERSSCESVHFYARAEG